MKLQQKGKEDQAQAKEATKVSSKWYKENLN